MTARNALLSGSLACSLSGFIGILFCMGVWAALGLGVVAVILKIAHKTFHKLEEDKEAKLVAYAPLIFMHTMFCGEPRY